MPRFALPAEGYFAVSNEGSFVPVLAWNAEVRANEENDDVVPVFAKPGFVAAYIVTPTGHHFSYPEWDYLGWGSPRL